MYAELQSSRECSAGPFLAVPEEALHSDCAGKSLGKSLENTNCGLQMGSGLVKAAFRKS